jgi:hypothetical protein
MRFIEINLLGVYVAPISLMMVAAWVFTIGLRRRRPFRAAAPCLAPGHVRFAIYMIVLSTIVLAVAAR